MKQDLYNNVKCINAVDPVAVASNTTLTGDIIDTAGFQSALFAISAGTLTDGTYTPTLYEGNDSGLSDAAAVADGDLIGTEAGATMIASEDGDCAKLGYKGTKRYLRLDIASTGVTTGGVVGATCMLGDPHVAPISTQSTAS